MAKLCIALVGLPGMGKSTVASKLYDGLAEEGIKVEIFNNGDLRRARLGPASSEPEFYNPENKEAQALRDDLARTNMRSMRDFFAAGGKVAVFDATNVSRGRREELQAFFPDIPVLFVGCQNDDPELLAASIARKARLPEFNGLSSQQAMRSFAERIEYYKRIFVPLGAEGRYLVLDTLHNRILKEAVGNIVPYYNRVRDILVSDWVRGLYLARHGQSEDNIHDRIGGDAPLTPRGREQALAMGEHFADRRIPYIFTSTLRRTIETAAPVAARQEDCRHIVIPEFNEIEAGECDGMTYEEIRQTRPLEYALRAKDKYGFIYPGGEGYVTLKERVDKGLKKALFLSGNLPDIVIVGHQAVNRMILSHFLYRRMEDVPYIYIPQDQYFRVVSTQRRKVFELVRFTDKNGNGEGGLAG